MICTEEKKAFKGTHMKTVKFFTLNVVKTKSSLIREQNKNKKLT